MTRINVNVSSVLRFSEVRRATDDVKATALNQGAQRLMDLSIPRTPKDIGNLRDATQVVPASPGDLVAKVTNDSIYAAYQHEGGPGWNYTEPGTGPKFLEGPAVENQDEIMGIVAATIRRSLS